MRFSTKLFCNYPYIFLGKCLRNATKEDMEKSVFSSDFLEGNNICSRLGFQDPLKVIQITIVLTLMNCMSKGFIEI